MHDPLPDLPRGWAAASIGQTCNAPQYGYTASAVSEPIGPRMLRITDIQDGHVEWSEVPYCDCDELDCNKYALRPGDILVARIGATTGKSFIIGGECPQSVFASYLIRLRPRAGIDPRFLYYFLNSRYYWRQVNREKHDKLKGGINATVLQKLIHFVPPVDEQRAIAAVLGRVQAAIAAEETVSNRTAELKAALMAKLFSKGTRGEAVMESPFGTVPQGWSITPLESCSVVQTGVAKGRKLNGDEIVEIPYLRVANVQDGHLDLREMKSIQLRTRELSRYRLFAGDVVLTEGGDFDKLGRGFIWNGQIDPCVHQNHVFAVRVDRSRIIPEFLAYLCQSPYGKAYFLTIAHKTTNLACINSAKLKALPVPIPPIQEQREIVAVLDGVGDSIDATRQRQDRLSELFAAMLDELMTGRTRTSSLTESEIEELNNGAMAGPGR